MASWQDEVLKGWELFQWDKEIQWFATRQEGSKKRTLGGRLYSLDRLIGTVRNAEALGWNLYLQANPSRRTGKIKLSSADIILWRFVIIDLDPGEDSLVAPCFGNLEGTRIFTGRGYQCWQELAAGIPCLNSARAAEYESVMRGYLKHLKGNIAAWAPGWILDTCCSDLARVVRCPGSINQKNGRRAEFEPQSISILLNYEQISKYYEPAPETQPMAENSTSLLDVLPHLTITGRKFILDGVESPGRHTACFHTVKLLKELGVPVYSATRWIMNGANNCRPHENSFVHDAQQTLEKVYGSDSLST